MCNKKHNFKKQAGNILAPANGSCYVYKPQGCGLTNEGTASYNVVGSSTNGSNLIWALWNLNPSVCKEINALLPPLNSDGDVSGEGHDAY